MAEHGPGARASAQDEAAPDAWSILDAVEGPVVVHDRAGRAIYANEAARALLLDLRERLDGRPAGQVPWAAVRADGSPVPPDELPIEVARTRGITVRGDVHGVPTVGGELRWLRVSARALDPTNLPSRVVVTFADVSHEVREQRRLERVAAEQRALVDGLFEGVVAQDAGGSIVASNPSAAATLGLTREQLEGRASVDPRWRAIHEDGSPYPGDTHPAMEALRTGEPQLMRTMGIRTPEGDLRWVLVNARPQLDEDGRVLGVVTSFLDVTEHRAAAERSAVLQQQLRTIVDRSPIGMGIVDADGVLLDVNEAFASIVGRRREDLLGRRRWLFTHPDDAPLERRLLADVVAGERDGYRLEKRYVRPDGSHVWVQADVAAIRGENGTLRTLVGQIQDIGDRRERDARLAHLADHDPLTGVLNRRGFDEALRRQGALARRYGRGGGVLLIDLDDFKAVNDTFGHEAGDAVLVRVASRLREALRASDVVGRLGGDEFAVILPDGDEDAVRAVVAALTTVVGDRCPDDAASAGPDVTASVGYALFGDAEDPSDLIRRADRSMYERKHRRRLPGRPPGPTLPVVGGGLD